MVIREYFIKLKYVKESIGIYTDISASDECLVAEVRVEI